jgi:hypothetical protein
MTGLVSVWAIDVFVAAIGVVLMTMVLLFYLGKLREARSKFTVGLTVLSATFLVQGLLAITFYLLFAQTYSAELALPLLALDILGLVGFATLFWLTRQ